MKYIVGFSGGIDSQAAANWALDAYGPDQTILLNADPGGNEHPMTTEFIEWFSDNVHHVHVCRAVASDIYAKEETLKKHHLEADQVISFGDLARLRGRFPYRKAQFCTELLKLRPTLRWIKDNIRDEYERISGVRSDESASRAKQVEREWDGWFNCWLHRPLFNWTKAQCFEFCQSKGQQINPLYSLGFNRVGCAPCINSSRSDVRNWAKRFPEMIDKVRTWEKRSMRTFFAPMVPGRPINWIDEVVEWANCERGGKQYSLDVYMPAPMCESIYGLCE